MARPRKFIRRVWFGVTQEQLDALDREVAMYGGDRADHMRRALDRYFATPWRKGRAS